MIRTLRNRLGAAGATLLIVVAASSGLWGDEKKKQPPSYAVIGGSVFRDPGFAVAGAQVTLEQLDNETGYKGKPSRKQKAETNFRGEFAFRVPPTAGKYSVSVTAKGLKGDTKQAATQGGEERIDVTFLLSPESK